MSQITPQIPIDILYEILEHIEDDRMTLFSCLLVNHIWCKISVRILWKNIQNFDTLVACLPNESIEKLRRISVYVTTPTKPLLFNYAIFVKYFSFDDINDKIGMFTGFFTSSVRKLIMLEIFVMLLNQATLKNLNIRLKQIPSIDFSSYPKATNCLKDLTKISYRSDLCSDFLMQMSRFCQNIRSMDVKLKSNISEGVLELISSQKNLKKFRVVLLNCENLEVLIPLLTKHSSSTLIKLEIDTIQITEPFTILNKFLNLNELILKYHSGHLDTLQPITFSKLRNLKFKRDVPKYEYMIKFLRINGYGLEVLEFGCYCHNLLNLAISEFCRNLRSLGTIFIKDEGETLLSILKNCQNLQSIHLIRSDDRYLEVKQIFEIIAKHSPKTFSELKLNFGINSNLSPIDLDNFFKNWSTAMINKWRWSAFQKPWLALQANFPIESIYHLELANEAIKVAKMNRISRWKNFKAQFNYVDLKMV
ncbi:2563_t:CDS:2 [Funneliformis geosporum]|uniref:2563_t:CDS:1 n=1 Tax=Funneliformis geosporum TaxID=1117311 RepID=A0A9W4SIL2_9GLOM|nr:2563_t:CDS:2 [Funneliformis geosporum]